VDRIAAIQAFVRVVEAGSFARAATAAALVKPRRFRAGSPGSSSIWAIRSQAGD